MPTPEEIRSKLTELLGQIANVPAEAVRDTAALIACGRRVRVIWRTGW